MVGTEAKDDAIAPSYRFVNITKPSEMWGQHNEHIIRSHVMRQVRKRQKLERSLVAKLKTDRRRGSLVHYELDKAMSPPNYETTRLNEAPASHLDQNITPPESFEDIFTERWTSSKTATREHSACYDYSRWTLEAAASTSSVASLSIRSRAADCPTGKTTSRSHDGDGLAITRHNKILDQSASCPSGSLNSTDYISAGTLDPSFGPLGPMCGARIDRFKILSIPIENRRDLELMDHLSTRLMPGFLTAVKGSSNPFVNFWLPRCAANSDLLHSFLYSSSCHLASRLSIVGQKPRLRREQLAHELKTITAIRQRLQKKVTSNEDIDDLLMIIVSLAGNGREGEILLSADPTPFYPVLTSARWLDTYGTLRFSDVHWNAITILVEKRGGVENLTIGLPWLITLMSLNRAALTLSKPTYPLLNPLCQPSKLMTCAEFDQEDMWSNFYAGRGHSFYVLKTLDLTPRIIETFVSLGNFSATLDAYCAGKIRSSLIGEIVESRETLQHRLLSLPQWFEVSELHSTDSFLDKRLSHTDLDLHAHLYEACRLAAQLYGIMVTFPIPRSRWAREHAVSNIRLELSYIAVQFNDPRLSEVQLWCVNVAGISAYDEQDRLWFRERARALNQILGVKNFTDAENLMRRFAWVSNACNRAGSNFWSL